MPECPARNKNMATTYDYLGRNVEITRSVNGWEPPDTDELKKLYDLLGHVRDRIHCLRVATSINYGKETGRVKRILVSRKKALKKAYQNGRNAGKKKHRHA
jgi:hypothetical protein